MEEGFLNLGKANFTSIYTLEILALKSVLDPSNWHKN